MKECSACQGNRMLEVTLRDNSGKNNHGCGNKHTVSCHVCSGKGYITEEDLKRYYHNLGCVAH